MSNKCLQKRVRDLSSDKPVGNLRPSSDSGRYYTDERGGVYEVTSLQEKENRRKHAIIKGNTEERNKQRYVNCYHEPIKDITSKLKLHELGTVLKLLPFLSFKHQDGLLTKDRQPMTMDDIAEAIGKSKRAATTVITTLVDAGVIVKQGTNRKPLYYVDRQYHTIGKTREGAQFTKLYQNQTKLRADKLSIQEAGLLYKMLPYFHYQTYYLCTNPNANTEDGEVLDHLSRKTLAELIDEDYKTVKNGINSLSDNGFVVKVSSHKVTHLLVNPDVMYRQESETEYTNHVRMMIAELERTSVKGKILH